MSGVVGVSVPVVSLFGPPPEGTVYCPGSRVEGDIAKIAKDHYDDSPSAPCDDCIEHNRCRHAKHVATH